MFIKMRRSVLDNRELVHHISPFLALRDCLALRSCDRRLLSSTPRWLDERDIEFILFCPVTETDDTEATTGLATNRLAPFITGISVIFVTDVDCRHLITATLERFHRIIHSLPIELWRGRFQRLLSRSYLSINPAWNQYNNARFIFFYLYNRSLYPVNTSDHTALIHGAQDIVCNL